MTISLGSITLIETDLMRARWVAHLLAFQQAVESTGTTKVLTFHSRVKAAEEFASDTLHGIDRYLNGYDVRHVHGKQRSSERKALIEAFRHGEKGMLTNARCLTEGVDVPAVDMVAFLDPSRAALILPKRRVVRCESRKDPSRRRWAIS